MSVAYIAKRSIEDELNRTGQSNVTMSAISYLIMFAYIVIARSFSILLIFQKKNFYLILNSLTDLFSGGQ